MADGPKFESFVRTAAPRLTGAAFLLVHDRHLAEDLAQETLIRMHRAWPSLRDIGAADAYAYRTLLRLAHRLRTRRKLRGEVVADTAAESSSHGEQDDADTRRVVRSQLRSLPIGQRETLVLRFYAQLTVDETARAMGCTAGTVKSQTAKGLASLRTRLTPTVAEHAPDRGNT